MRSRQKGAALLVVLLLVATLSVIAIGMTRTLRLSTAKTLAGETFAQARWYVVSMETLGVQIMQQQWQLDPGRDTVEDQWVREPAIFPVDNGTIIAHITDENSCFNINSLVESIGDGYEVNDDNTAEYRRLLDVLGFDNLAQGALTDAAIDWLDTNTQTRQNGAEDADYARLEKPYRAGNTLMSDISELRAVFWYSPDVYKLLRPYLCAYPTTDVATVNINLMTGERHIPVLYAMMNGLMTEDQTRQLINALPEGGYRSVEDFWASAGFTQEKVPKDLFDRPKLWSQYVRLEANVKYDRAFMTLQSLLKIENTGQAQVIARKFGSDE